MLPSTQGSGAFRRASDTSRDTDDDGRTTSTCRRSTVSSPQRLRATDFDWSLGTRRLRRGSPGLERVNPSPLDGFRYSHYIMTMVTRARPEAIPAGRFKAQCLRIMDEVRRTRRPVVITKRGVPVAKVVPPDDEREATRVFGCLADVIEIRGDITKPLEPSDSWETLEEWKKVSK